VLGEARDHIPILVPIGVNLVCGFKAGAGGVMGATTAANPTVVFYDSLDGQYDLRFPQKIGEIERACGDYVDPVESLVEGVIYFATLLVDVPTVLLEMS
jgi:hypothetical protein